MPPIPPASCATIVTASTRSADGVLMRTSHAWAVARADGSVEVGPFPKAHLTKVPVLRVVAGLVPALGMGLRAIAAGSRKGRAGRGGRRLLVALIGVSILGFLAPRLPGSDPSGPMTAVAGVLGIEHAAARKRYSRALAALAELLEGSIT